MASKRSSARSSALGSNNSSKLSQKLSQGLQTESDYQQRTVTFNDQGSQKSIVSSYAKSMNWS